MFSLCFSIPLSLSLSQMSGAPRVRSSNLADSEARPVFGPAGTKVQRLGCARKPKMKTLRNEENSLEEVVALAEESNGLPSSPVALPLTPLSHSVSIPSALSRQEHLLYSNLSLNASCSSDASSEWFHSRASTGRIYRRNSMPVRRKQLAMKKDTRYAAFHDEEWGLPVHDDKKLFELLIFSGALAELTWPTILNKRHIFRVFADFDPISVAKFSEKKIAAPGRTASLLLSELKLRAIVENARQISKGNIEGSNNQDLSVNVGTSASSHNVLHGNTISAMDVDVTVNIPFALVDEIAEASPAAEDGLQLGDQIVKFGNVESGDDLLPKLASEALSNQDREIPVVVLRQGALINLTVTPRVWQGRGLLGWFLPMRSKLNGDVQTNYVISESYDRLHGALMNSDASVRPARRQCPSRCVLNILSPLCQSIGVKGWLLSFKLLDIFGFCMKHL
ncbi:unnamed protein product [Camellia sinensis]